MDSTNENLSDQSESDVTKVDEENNKMETDSGDVESASNLDRDTDKAEVGENSNIASEDVVAQENIENEVYNITDEIDSTPNVDFHEEEELTERAPKRTMTVITIDSDSDDSSVCHVESYQATASEAKKLRRRYSSSESESVSSSDESDYNSEDAPVIADEPSALSRITCVQKKKPLSLTDIKMNACFSSDSLNEKFLSHWSKCGSFSSKNLTLHNEPFQICILDEFLEDTAVINNIVDGMNTLDWSRRIMDLYEFHRTTDLCNLTWQRSIKSIYELLKTNVMKWVAKITNTELTHISASCALYGPGDHLLVHDDLVEDRKIAFIYYMAPWNISNDEKENDEIAEKNVDSVSGKEDLKDDVDNKSELDSKEADAKDEVNANTNKIDSEIRTEKGWTKSMGGELEFFAIDENGKPTVPVKSLLPRNNTFTFFKVEKKSFHQVSEVTTFDYPRLTINGWFHGPMEKNETEKSEGEEETSGVSEVQPVSENNVVQQTLEEWITPIYLTTKCKRQILVKFEETSEISLVSYFTQQKYDDTLDILKKDEIPWEHQGPANVRNYHTLPIDKLKNEESYSPILKLVEILTCKNFVNTLHEYTGLNFQSYCKLEIQRWTRGNYAVLPVKDEYSKSEVDVIIHLGCPERPMKSGTMTYILPEEQDSDSVISIGLKNNSLSIVYSEAGLARFTKYVNKLSVKEDEYFYMVVCTYRE